MLVHMRIIRAFLGGYEEKIMDKVLRFGMCVRPLVSRFGVSVKVCAFIYSPPHHSINVLFFILSLKELVFYRI